MAATKLTEPPVTSLHDVVIDYLVNQAYSGTARVLAKSHRPTRLETDSSGEGDGIGSSAAGGGAGVGEREDNGFQLDEETLNAIEQRSAILNYILSGAIIRAVDALNTHFPSVLASSERSNGIPIPSVSESSTPTNGHYSGLGSGSAGASHGTVGGSSVGALSTSAGSTVTSQSASWRRSGGSGQWPPSLAPSSDRQAFGATLVSGSGATGMGSYGSTSGSLGAGSSTSLGNGTSNGNGSVIGTVTGLTADHTTPMFISSSDPDHVRLNLQIQQFIELFRQLGPSSPSSSASSIASIPPAAPLNGSHSNGGSMPLTNTLTALQNLHAEAKKMSPEDRAVYLVEIKDVGALLAYTDPETSILRGFLQQDRRMALARQVNAAILRSQGRHIQSHLELCARRVSALYTVLAEHSVELQLPPAGPPGAPNSRLISELRRNDLRGGFNLRQYAAQTWS